MHHVPLCLHNQCSMQNEGKYFTQNWKKQLRQNYCKSVFPLITVSQDYQHILSGKHSADWCQHELEKFSIQVKLSELGISCKNFIDINIINIIVFFLYLKTYFGSIYCTSLSQVILLKSHSAEILLFLFM